MFSFSNAKVWLYRKPIDFRKQMDSLIVLVAARLQDNPTSGHVFAFRNKSADKIKLLYWEGDGFWLLYKRLERSKFKFPSVEDEKFEITVEQLHWLLSGLDIMDIKEKVYIEATRFF